MTPKSKLITLMLEHIPTLQFIYLFGSVAKNEDHQGSDIDIAFAAHSNIPNTERWEIQQKMSFALDRQVDLIDLSQASDIMKMQIISTGTLLYAQDPNRVDSFENNIYSKYIDLKELNKGIYDDIARTGKVYG